MILTKEQLFLNIQSVLQEMNYSDALTMSNQLIQEYGDDEQCYILLGDVYLKMGNINKSINYYEKILDINPGSAAAYFKMGLAYELKEDLQSALSQYQTASNLDPSNTLYKGCLGNIIYHKGKMKGDASLMQEGIYIMENAIAAGASDQNLKDELANAHLDQYYATWNPHPENKDDFLATEYAHIIEAKEKIEKAKYLADGFNSSLINRITEIENYVKSLEDRKNFGLKYIQKVPIIAGVIFLIFGSTGLGIGLLLMAVLYFFSQRKPVYLANRMYYKNNYRDPLVIRRIQEMYNYLSSFTFYGSFSNIFFMTTLLRILTSIFSYSMVLLLLPYEIIKGFIVNYDLLKKINTGLQK